MKKNFNLCAHGEIGFFLTKHTISALPDTDEKPIKVKRKATFDGWEREVEDEERAFPSTKEQVKKMHQVFRNNLYMCLISFPQHPQFNVTKTDMDDWYEWFGGKDIAERKPPPSESIVVYAERNAWREIHNKVTFEGATLKDAMQDLRQDSLFWTWEVYERRQTRGISHQAPVKGRRATRGPQGRPSGPRARPSPGPLLQKARGSPRRKTKVGEEREMGMVPGPFTTTEAAAYCGCTPEELCPGPMAAIDERVTK